MPMFSKPGDNPHASEEQRARFSFLEFMKDIASMRRGHDSGYNSMKSTDALSHQFHARHDSRDYSVGASPLPKPSDESVELEAATSPYFTRGARQKISLPTAEVIAQKLKAQATASAVDLRAFGIEQDIAFESLERLVQVSATGDFPRVLIDVDQRSFLCSDAFADDVKTTIRQTAEKAGPSTCDLAAAFENRVPPAIIVALAIEATSGMAGEVHLSGDHVVWTHTCAGHTHQHVDPAEAQELEDLSNQHADPAKTQKVEDLSNQHADPAKTQRIEDLSNQLALTGFCVLPVSEREADSDDDLGKAVVSFHRKAHPHDAEPKVIHTTPFNAVAEFPSPKAKALVQPRTLGEELECMKAAVVHRAELMWQDESGSAAPFDIVRQLEPGDFNQAHDVELGQILLHSDYIEDLEAVAQRRTIELERHRYNEFHSIVETQLWCPLHLYAAGIIETKDAILRRDLEDYAVEQFRRQNIPQTIAAIREQKMLHDERRAAALEQLEFASQHVKLFIELQTAVVEAGRDLQIESPHKQLVLHVKHRSLEKAVVKMQEMDRGLDILQNLIWVLLATSGPGLFVGSVKYTSKMIQQYDRIGGDAEVSGMLRLWWDKVRDGLFNGEDLRQMKALARDAVDVWRQETR